MTNNIIHISDSIHDFLCGEQHCISLILQLCNQLNEIHQSGLTHLDICPENIEFSSDNEKISLLFPLGLFPLDEPVSLSQFLYWGDPYHAPELRESILTGQTFLPAASSDVYSLMLTIYFLITGQLVPYNFQFHNKWKFILRQSTIQWSRESQHAIESLFYISTRLDPSQRPQNTADLMQTASFLALKNAMGSFS